MSNNDDSIKTGVQPKLSGIALLKQRQKQLAARIASMEAREKSNERKKDTRRKILIGAYYLDLARKMDTMNELANTLDTYLTRESDRALFGLPVLEEEKKTKSTKGESQKHKVAVNLTEEAETVLSATSEM